MKWNCKYHVVFAQNVEEKYFTMNIEWMLFDDFGCRIEGKYIG